MTREEAIEVIKEAYGNSEYTDEIMKALEQQHCDDCISRAEALKAIEKEKQGWEGTERYAIDECHTRIADLPSVTPQPKMGRWINSKCDKCGASRPPLFDNYCPNCGAKMEEVE